MNASLAGLIRGGVNASLAGLIRGGVNASLAGLSLLAGLLTGVAATGAVLLGVLL